MEWRDERDEQRDVDQMGEIAMIGICFLLFVLLLWIFVV